MPGAGKHARLQSTAATGGQEEPIMKISYNYTGDQKKRMVKAIGEALDEKPVYLGTPSCAYKIAEFMVTRDGNFEFPDETDTEIVNGLLDALETAGFTFPEDAPSANGDSEYTETDEDAGAGTEAYGVDNVAEEETETGDPAAGTDSADGPTELTISLPLMAPDALERLKRLVEGKTTLIRKALDADSLAITLTDKLNFPWWNHMPEQDEVAAYMAFLAALCRMAQNAKRVNVKDKPVESEKYAFRIFLIRLGFSGQEHKETRHQLMKRLSGNAAFRNAEEERKFRERRGAIS